MVYFTVNARVLRDATRYVKKTQDAHQVAAKHARRKPSEESAEELSAASRELQMELLDSEAVVRQAKETGLKTKVLEEVIETSANALTKSDQEVALRIEQKEKDSEKAKKEKEKKGGKKGKDEGKECKEKLIPGGFLR